MNKLLLSLTLLILLSACTSNTEDIGLVDEGKREICTELSQMGEEKNAGKFSTIFNKCMDMTESQRKVKFGELDACETKCKDIFDGARVPGK